MKLSLAPRAKARDSPQSSQSAGVSRSHITRPRKWRRGSANYACIQKIRDVEGDKTLCYLLII